MIKQYYILLSRELKLNGNPIDSEDNANLAGHSKSFISQSADWIKQQNASSKWLK